MTIQGTLKGLPGWLLVAFLAAAAGGLGSANAPEFYSQLALPRWAPPAWLFGPVWSMLYLMMGLASWLVWRAGGWRAARVALTLYSIQLVVNALWSWQFFAWQLGALAFVDIVVLWLLLAATLVTFWRVSRLAAVLLVPYLGWVSFATALAWSAWRMNPSLLG